jgi:hypothetical protein
VIAEQGVVGVCACVRVCLSACRNLASSTVHNKDKLYSTETMSVILKEQCRLLVCDNSSQENVQCLDIRNRSMTECNGQVGSIPT